MTESIFTEEYQRFREELVQLRKQQQLTQSELAALLGKPQSYVSKFERAERRLDVVEFLAVCRALSADPCLIIKKLGE